MEPLNANIVHGGEPGPETIAQECCRKLGIDTIVKEAVTVMGEAGNFRYD